ncbi:Uncharacterised protein [Mycobacteroides abscessus subsp. abscessus]|nr:Uncharacterised protein [Mycobacteroides abscessus subsp. abscessus]
MVASRRRGAGAVAGDGVLPRAVGVVEQGVGTLEGVPTVLTGVEAGPEGPQRHEALGGQQQGEESVTELHRPGHESDADDDGDEGDGDRRDEFEGEAGEEGDAQSRQTRRMVVVAETSQGARVLPGAAEADEDGQSLGELSEVVRELFEGADALLRRLLGVAADEDHEERHEREAEDDDDRREHIGEDDPHEEDGRDDRGLREGGDDGGEVVVEVVDAAGDGDRGLRARLAGAAQQSPEDPGAQPSLGSGGLRGSQAVVGPQARPAQGRPEHAEDDPERDGPEVEDRAHERLGDEDDADRADGGRGESEDEGPPAPGQGQEDPER